MGLRKIGSKDKFSKFFVILLSSIIILSSLFSINNVKADYNIEEGDTFQFKVTTLHNFSDLNMTYVNTDIGVTFASGSEITLIVLTFIELTETAQIKCRMLVDDYDPYDTALLSGFIFVNRNWDELQEEWAPPVFETYETKLVWGVKSYAAGEMEIEYVKKDGVLNRFYAYEYPLITSLGIKEILIERTDVDLAGFTWLAMLPSFILGVSLIVYLRSKRNTK